MERSSPAARYGLGHDKALALTFASIGSATGATLTGLNQLLEPQTHVLTEAITSDQFQELTPDQKLRAYGAMIFGVYRPQPLLIQTGLLARGIQRALKPNIKFALDWYTNDTRFARCEFPAIQHDSTANQTFDFNIIDETAGSLAQTLAWPDQWSEVQSPKIVADGISRAIRQSNSMKWEENYSSSTQQRTLQSFENPVLMSLHFTTELRPYVH